MIMKKKILYLNTLLLAALVFTACPRKPVPLEPEPVPNSIAPTEITATNVKYSDNDIATVKAIGDNNRVEIASAEYKNGGFKLNLPATLPDECLSSAVSREFGNKISDKEAQICRISYFFAYNSAGKKIGRIDLEDKINYTSYYYADRDFTVKESGYACYFKKGWNMDYRYGGKSTTKDPSSESSFSWTFLGDTWWYGEKAGNEFCDCIKSKNDDVCFKKLKSDYGFYTTISEFVEGLNMNTCGYIFYITTTTVRSSEGVSFEYRKE